MGNPVLQYSPYPVVIIKVSLTGFADSVEPMESESKENTDANGKQANAAASQQQQQSKKKKKKSGRGESKIQIPFNVLMMD